MGKVNVFLPLTVHSSKQLNFTYESDLSMFRTIAMGDSARARHSVHVHYPTYTVLH